MKNTKKSVLNLMAKVGMRSAVKAAGSTTCNSSLCSFVYVSVKGYYTATQYLSDSNYAVRDKVPVGFPADSEREFIKVTSYHSATINGISGDDDMIVTL